MTMLFQSNVTHVHLLECTVSGNKTTSSRLVGCCVFYKLACRLFSLIYLC